MDYFRVCHIAWFRFCHGRTPRLRRWSFFVSLPPRLPAAIAASAGQDLMSAFWTGQLFALKTEKMSAAETRQVSSAESGQMSVTETEHMSSVETRENLRDVY